MQRLDTIAEQSQQTSIVIVYPSVEDVMRTLQTRGIDWCGLRCRFHRRNHAPVTPQAVEEMLSFLSSSPNLLVGKKTPSTWWIS